MKLDQLRRMALFAMVAEEGSFTAVAQKQHIATSAISSAITQLENDIGTRLLHRTTRKINLTDEGQVFLRRCKAMLYEATVAHEDLAQVVGQLVGTLTITASQWQVEAWLLPALAPLLQSNPKLILNLLVGDRRLDLVEHQIDIAIRGGELADSTLIARPIEQLPEWIVAAPSYVDQYGMPDDANNLNDHRILAFAPFSQPQQLTLIDKQGQMTTAQLSIGGQSDSVEAISQLAQMGFGIARLPKMVIEQPLSQGKLVRVLTQYTLPTIKTYAVTSKRDLQPAKVIAALDAIHAFMSQVTSE